MGHVAPLYNVYICLTVIHSNNIVVCRSNSFRFVWFGFVGKFVHCLAEIIIECHLNDKLGSWKGGKLKPWSLVYCFTLRAFQLCIKLSRDIKTLCSCRLTLCTSGLSMISISRTLSSGMGMQGVKSYSFLYTKKRDENKTQQKGTARWGGIAFRGVVRCFLFSTLLQVYK